MSRLRGARAAGRRGTPGRVVLLGPMPSREALATILDEVAPRGPVATIRAGWQEWEAEPGLLTDALGDRAVPLDLHARAEGVWREDPELTDAHRDMQQSVRLQRRAYNVRLSAAMGAWEELNGLDDPGDLLAAERTAALDAVRALDEHQLRRIGAIRAAFVADVRLADRPVIRRERDEIAGLLEETAAVVVDGGHVAVLLNRIRLFGVEDRLPGRTTIGISGGAMVLTDRVVLFHDSPPWGPGHAEVAEPGLGVAPGVVVLPHASDRLRLDDPVRVGCLARRLAPAECIALDGGASLTWDGTGWTVDDARRLSVDGEVVDRSAAA